MNKVQLLLENHIHTEEFGTIYFPTVDYLIKHGDAGYDRLILPFALTTDMLNIPEDYKIEIKVFDMFFQGFILDVDINKTYYDLLLDSLRFYFRIEPIFDEKNYCIRVGDKYIHRNNFDELADIIIQVSKSKRIVVEKPPTFENDVQRDVYEKITEGRRKKNQNTAVSFATIINIAMNGGNTYISPEEISKMTIFQLVSRYEFIVETDFWNINFDKYLAGEDPKKLDLIHWASKIKL